MCICIVLLYYLCSRITRQQYREQFPQDLSKDMNICSTKHTLSISVLKGTVAQDSFLSIVSFLGRRFRISNLEENSPKQPQFNVFSIYSHGKILLASSLCTLIKMNFKCFFNTFLCTQIPLAYSETILRLKTTVKRHMYSTCTVHLKTYMYLLPTLLSISLFLLGKLQSRNTITGSTLISCIKMNPLTIKSGSSHGNDHFAKNSFPKRGGKKISHLVKSESG